MSFEYKNDSSYELWALAHSEAPQSKTTRFMTLSAIFHVALFVGAAVLSTPLVEAVKVETITIDLADSSQPISRGLMIPATEGRQAEKAAPADKNDILVPVAKASSTKSVAKPAKAPKQKSVRSAAAPAPSQVAPQMATIDDIDAPEIDQSMAETQAETAAPVDALKDVDQDLEQIDLAENKKLNEEKSKLDQEADQVDSEAEEALSSLDEDSREQAAALAQANQNRRAQDAKAIAAAAQGEREAAAARAAALAKSQRQALGTQGQGAGAQGAKHSSPSPAGGANGVRSLSQLRQMPGNRGPQYSQMERLKRQSGVVSFLAYVTKEGHLAKFKQLSSTGYKNLDSKTLTALEKWRFYPGQEGWVELPIRWDLRGEPQAAGGMLRVSRR